MLRLLPPMLVALAEALAAIGTARAILRLAGRGPDLPSWLDRSYSAQLLVGLPLYGTLLFLTGLISTSTIVVCAITLPLALYAIVDANFGRPANRDPLRARDWFGASALVTAGVVSFLFAQLPAFSLDELAYHLAVPMQWIIGGRVEAFPLISHSWFPFGIESAHLFSLRLLRHDGAVASHFVHLLCGAALTSLLVRRLAVASTAPLFLAAGIVTTPALLVTVGWSWNDVPLIGIAVVLFLALEQTVHAGQSRVLTGLAVCAGLLTKYTFAPLAALQLCVALALSEREKRRPLLRAVGLGAVSGSVFLVRNALLTGNPFAPLFAAVAPAVSGYRSSGNLLETLGSYVFEMRFFDEALGVSLLMLATFGVARAPSRFARAASLALFAACAGLVLLAPSARILLPFLVVPALVGAAVVGGLGAVRRRLVTVAIGAAITAQLSGAALYVSAHRAVSLLTGEVSVPDWLIANRPITSDVLWINAGLPATSRTLVIGIQELFWFDRIVRGGGNFDGPRIAAYLDAGDAERLRERLRRDGITHVVLDRGLVSKPSADIKRRERETFLDATTMETLVALLQQQTIVAAKGPIFIFELK